MMENIFENTEQHLDYDHSKNGKGRRKIIKERNQQCNRNSGKLGELRI